ncbi:sulfotransferase family protein [Salinibacter ruber]|uniref:sulfotransferase family protein n=1 Tax=Salinibacter ruber TaxID=146919 RepID=UPI0021D44690|nr:sulfotransferase [Salinibacter ruber]
MTSESRPIYIIGRQHCGNTMLATMLGHHPDLYAFTNEGNFFEHVESIRSQERREQIRSIAREIRRGGGAERQTEEEIVACLREKEGLNAFDRYIVGKDIVAAKQGASRWVQKATSYVFQVESILQAFPDAKLLFLIRNPLDLAASIKRRGYYQHHIWRTMWGWNTGVQKALTWMEKYPESIQAYRYEDLVEETDSVIRDISDFCGIDFDPRCTKVQHVNPSEDPYSRAGEEGRPDKSRMYYYPDVLNNTDEVAVRTLVSSSPLDAFYPSLPPPPEEPTLKHRLRAARFVLASIGASGWQHIKMLGSDPAHTVRRLKKRLVG